MFFTLMEPISHDEHAFAAGHFALALGHARSDLSPHEVAAIIREVLSPSEIRMLIRELQGESR